MPEYLAQGSVVLALRAEIRHPKSDNPTLLA